MKKITGPEPKCPNCGSYNVSLIFPRKKLTGDYMAVCKDCLYTDYLDAFYHPDPEKLLKSIYD
jgi:hypothetical protein